MPPGGVALASRMAMKPAMRLIALVSSTSMTYLRGNVMDTTPNWAKAACYTPSTVKAELIAMALALHHAWMQRGDALRTTEMALIEARATIKAQQVQIEANAHTLRKAIAAQNRNSRVEHEEFTFAQLREASAQYCDLHGCRSVSMDAVKEWLRSQKG